MIEELIEKLKEGRILVIPTDSINDLDPLIKAVSSWTLIKIDTDLTTIEKKSE